MVQGITWVFESCSMG